MADLKRKRTADGEEDEPAYSRKRVEEREGQGEVSLLQEMPHISDSDPARRREREKQAALRMAEQELNGQQQAARKEEQKLDLAKMAMTRGGGTYIPPHRMRAMMAEQAAQSSGASVEFQRLTWEALRKSINGLINKVNVANIKFIVPDLFGENLIRGRGLFARSIMRAQAASLPFTPVFACLLSIVNSKLPKVGELVLHRLIIQFRRAFKRNDKPTCIATLTFLAQLVNQRVVNVLLIMEILQLLLERPTDDSVEIAVGLTREIGAFLQDEEPKFNNALYEMYRDVLHSSEIDKRVQFMVEVLFQVRKDRFKDNPVLPEGLDLVEDDDQVQHSIGLTDQLNNLETLNIFKADPEYEKHEEEYRVMKAEILGGSEDEDGSDAEGSDAGTSEDEAGENAQEDLTGTVDIHDFTGTNLVNLRRRIYLTIQSSLDFQEAVHKLLQIELGPSQEIEMVNMIVECCSQEKTFGNFFGLMAERLCKLNPIWSESFETAFRTYYTTIHRYETNRLRNIARLFGHLLGTDALPWTVCDVIKLNEDDTTSSSRIFIKIMSQEMMEMLGMHKLRDRFSDPTMRPYYDQMFPLDSPKNTRFAINFWTSIGLGILTENMREHLKNMPAQIMAAQRAMIEDEDSSSSDSDSDSSDLSSSSDSDSSDDSRSPRRDVRRRSSTPPRDRRRSPEPLKRSINGSSRRPISRSRSPPPASRRSHRSPGSDYKYDRRNKRSPSPDRRRRYESRSPPPARRRRRSSSYDSDRSRSPSRSPPRKSLGRARSPPVQSRRRRSPSSFSSRSRTRSPPRKGFTDRAQSPAPRRRRSPSSISNRSRSRSPPRKSFVHPDRARAADFYEDGENRPPPSNNRRR